MAKSQNAAAAAKAQLGVASARGAGGKLMAFAGKKKESVDGGSDDGKTTVDRYQLSELIRWC